MALTNYRPDIDGLRAVAVLAVVLHHLSASLVPGGYVGVDVFFVISGYLITRIISREMEEGSFTFARFYERRARRIFPALFAVLAVTLMMGYVLLLPSDYSETMRGVLGTLFFASNILFWRDMADGYFAATDAGLNPLLHTWSLAVEEQFYVFFPFLLILCFRFFRRHIILALIGCTVVSLAGSALLIQSKSVAVFFLSPFRAWEMLIGALLAFNAIPALKLRAAREVIAGVGLLAILLTCFIYDAKTTFPGLTALVPVLGAAALIHAGASGSSFAGRLLEWRPVVYIGLISYSLYLWHWPLIVLTRFYTGLFPIWLSIPGLLALSLLLGSVSYHFIEKPFRRSFQVSSRALLSITVGLASILIVVSTFGLQQNGFENRFTSEVVNLDKARAPLIPFRECDGRPPLTVTEGCTLGASGAEITMLVWGDSHAMSWAPALNKILISLNTRAVLATYSSCPPFFGGDGILPSRCSSKSEAVKMYLAANPGIRFVVMSAFWPGYFGDASPLKVPASIENLKIEDVAGSALISTLEWMRGNGRSVVLLGPVPTYDANVPQVIALEKITGRALLQHKTLKAQKEKSTFFYEAVKSFQKNPSFVFLDPVEWMCVNYCEVERDGVSLYRDKNHLSITGAMAFEAEIKFGLGRVVPITSSVFDAGSKAVHIDKMLN